MVSSDSLMLVLVMTIVILPNSRLGQTVVGVTMAGKLTHQNPPRPTRTHQDPPRPRSLCFCYQPTPVSNQ